eukprot:SAG22_NODE_3936_length_1462_cov_1.258254_2_plen_135_part_00
MASPRPQQLAAFERDGYVVVPDVLPPPALGALREAMAEGLGRVPPAVPSGWLAVHPTEHDGGVQPVEHEMAGAGPHGATSRRYPHPIEWMGPAFLASLVDNPAVRPLLAAALGDDFVLDHDCESCACAAALGLL